MEGKKLTPEEVLEIKAEEYFIQNFDVRHITKRDVIEAYINGSIESQSQLEEIKSKIEKLDHESCPPEKGAFVSLDKVLIILNSYIDGK